MRCNSVAYCGGAQTATCILIKAKALLLEENLRGARCLQVLFCFCFFLKCSLLANRNLITARENRSVCMLVNNRKYHLILLKLYASTLSADSQ